MSLGCELRWISQFGNQMKMEPYLDTNSSIAESQKYSCRADATEQIRRVPIAGHSLHWRPWDPSGQRAKSA
jgi:hypothetical protein